MSDEQNKNSVQNPLLAQLRIPGETFRLPSGGIFYTHDELDPSVKNGEVHVYPMTAIDEITLRTPDKLFSGDAIVDVFTSCIPQIKNPKMLFSKDVDYLLVCLRMLSYGPTVSLSTKHSCENAKDHEYNVELRTFITKTKSIDPTTVNETFSVKMENGQVVHLQPARFNDIIKLYQAMDKTGVETPETVDIEKLKITLVDNLANMITKVDDVSDKSLISDWLRKIPVSWTYKLSDAINGASDWGPDFKTSVICQDCQQPFEVSAPINPIAFFT